ncbi:MAG: hypothetical protein QW524_00280 [Candidatus Woesearchaeota archaeon]
MVHYEISNLIDALSHQVSFEQPYQDYYLKIKEKNLRVLEEFKKLLQCDNDAICTVGSDARLEKGYASKIELIVLLNDCSNEKYYMDLVNTFSNVFHPAVEFKRIDQKSYLYMNDEHRVFPMRVIDLLFLNGNYDRFVLEKKKFFNELKEEYSKIKSKIKEKRGYVMRILEKGWANFKGERITHYNLKDRTIFYDNNVRWGFKYGPLRSVQYDIAYRLIKILKSQDDANLLLALPTNTVDRLYFLGDLIYPYKDIEILADNYMYFLKEYHRIQKKYVNNFSKDEKGIVCMIYDQNTINEISERIRAMLSVLKHKSE